MTGTRSYRALVYLFGAIAGILIISNLSSSKRFKISEALLAPNQPRQTSISVSKIWESEGFQFRAMAEFEIKALVVSRSRYRFDTEAALSPVDLVLAWGPLSDTRILNQISFNQRGRYYSWRVGSIAPISLELISQNTANMHLIPGDSLLRRRLLEVSSDQLIYLKGYLVEISNNSGWRWISSLSRNDTGAGACELLWVEELQVLPR